jgi:hypothetical protein
MRVRAIFALCCLICSLACSLTTLFVFECPCKRPCNAPLGVCVVIASWQWLINDAGGRRGLRIGSGRPRGRSLELRNVVETAQSPFVIPSRTPNPRKRAAFVDATNSTVRAPRCPYRSHSTYLSFHLTETRSLTLRSPSCL